MRKKVLVSLYIISLMCVCCHEFNTATPQASSTILNSKKSEFYLSTANKLQTGDLDIIDSVWIEKVWHYKVIEGEKRKVSLSPNNQIVLKLKKASKEFKKSEYLLEWKIVEKHFGNLGSGNGVFMVTFPKTTRIDTLHFLLHKVKDNSTIDIGTFVNLR
ncbi:hypothetical protein EYY60_08025 [Flavobacterium zhairuonense]|uniref:hypothetical protein n=1 Tax=Flavobacterium zhairuonense TaxID=2493631 RepID=UPI0010466571|nr:hypothetical protein [Flavobacterium zhairuonense]KAF2511369.1 hypothetical protein EYY60_08025 [Flavobacterium zhairuonense]